MSRVACVEWRLGKVDLIVGRDECDPVAVRVAANAQSRELLVAGTECRPTKMPYRQCARTGAHSRGDTRDRG